MSLLTLPQAKLSELSLRQRLSHYQQNYLWEEGKLELTVSEPPSSLNCILQLQWKGTHFTLYCFGNDLANWLTADLLGLHSLLCRKSCNLRCWNARQFSCRNWSVMI